MSEDQGQRAAVESEKDLMGYLIGPLFVALMLWFLLGPDLLNVPEGGTGFITAGEITTDPLRTPMTDPPTALMGGYDLKCVECHKLFPSLPETARRLTQHRHIELDHGLNNRCFNCHDYDQRDRLTLPGERTVSFGETARLCATCHGTVYRDWQRGIHGRTNGHWDPAYGTQIRLTCTECHDPHRPAFDPMSVLPGPNTLRMGDPNDPSHEVHEEKHNPLRLPDADHEVPSNHSNEAEAH